MTRLDSALEPLRPLLGRWRGAGEAHFPTIPSASYRETLEFTADPERPLVHFEQRAQQAPLGTEQWIASHWESGFLRIVEPGLIELTNAQDNGRLEILRLTLTAGTGGLVLEGPSIGLFNDPRMVTSHRRFEVSGDTLAYAVTMSTTRVAAPTRHLTATLHRDSPGT